MDHPDIISTIAYLLDLISSIHFAMTNHQILQICDEQMIHRVPTDRNYGKLFGLTSHKEISVKIYKLTILHHNHFNYVFNFIDLYRCDSIICRGQKFESIPQFISELSNLKLLDLSGNGITHIPDELFDLPNLSAICLSNNNITHIPASIVNAKKLTNVGMYANMLTTLPDELFQVTSLTDISLGKNKLTYISSHISMLTNLIHLDISQNQITQLPDTLCTLSNLKTLDISINPITVLPDLTILPALTDFTMAGINVPFPKKAGLMVYR